MKRHTALVAFLFGWLLIAHAQSPDEQYLRIYNLIQEGDVLADGGASQQALAKYMEAEANLKKFKEVYPSWNAQVISYRLNYVETKLAPLVAKFPPSAAPSTPPTKATPATQPGPAPASATDVLAAELSASREQLNRLQQDNTLLQAKLREALSVQPANADPRELTRAEEHVRSLQKENELLKVSLDDQRTRISKPVESIESASDKKAVTELKRTVTQQKDTIASLEKEKAALVTQVTDARAAAKRTDPQVSQQLSEAQQTVASLRAANEKLQSEQASLTKQLAAAPRPAPPDTSRTSELESQLKAAALESTKSAEQLRKVEADRASLEQANKELQTKLDAALTKQVAATTRPAPPETSRTSELESQLKAATLENARSAEQLRKLEIDRASLEQTNKELHAKLDAVPATSKKSDAKKIKELEEENDDLKQRVNTLTKDLNRRSVGGGRNATDAAKQIETLRARLDVLEARQVPYTSEELALLNKPEATLAAPDPKAAKKSLKEIPPGAGTLVAEAQKAFEARRYEDAEKKYLEVLRQDEKNVYILANLAAIQLELNKLDAAEKNLKQSLTLDPDDAFSLSMWGILKFRQKNYDEALNALSRSAKLDPDRAETQNYLGITLSQKGLRGPAETALRKSLQLRPRYSDAHHNLAVVYATHQPPSLELARWHYDRAIALGHTRTPDLEKVLAEKKPTEGNP